jgi:hypothetical protein
LVQGRQRAVHADGGEDEPQKSLADIRAFIGVGGAMSGNPGETVLAQATTEVKRGA